MSPVFCGTNVVSTFNGGSIAFELECLDDKCDPAAANEDDTPVARPLDREEECGWLLRCR